jgi:DNA-directed RNA polymerase
MFPYENAIAWASGATELTPDDPWCFIAACIEYHQCVITKERTFTNLPCAVDATCSGIQIISAMMLDQVGAGYVNLLPSALPQDIYAHCAERSVDFMYKAANSYKKVEHRLNNEQVERLIALMRGKHARKLAKVVVMTVPYNAQTGTQEVDIKDKAKELGVTLVGMEAWTLVTALRNALFDTVPALKVMQQIGAQMKKLSAANEQSTFTWTSPSGVVVSQTKQEGVLKKTRIAGKDIAYRINKPVPDPTGHMTATCPNLVHSLDAALLHLTFAECEVPFGLIHDSVLARATDIDEIVVSLKRTFIDMFSEDILGKFALEVGIDITALQKQGSLDLEKVMESEYFFS